MEDIPKTLLICPDCKGVVSRRATACPHCGCPMDVILREQPPSKAEEPAPAPVAAPKAQEQKATATPVRKSLPAPMENIANPLYFVSIPPPGVSSPDFWEAHLGEGVVVDALSFQSIREALRDAENREDEEEQYEDWVEPPMDEREADDPYYDDDDSGPDEEPYGYYFGDDEIW